MYDSEPNFPSDENLPPADTTGFPGRVLSFIRGNGGGGPPQRVVPNVYPPPKIEPQMNAYADAFHEYEKPGVRLDTSDRATQNLGLKRLFAFGARRYLERMYLDHISRYIEERPEQARLGGEMSTKAHVLAFLRCTYVDGFPREYRVCFGRNSNLQRIRKFLVVSAFSA